MNRIKTEKRACEKTMIFCATINAAARLHRWIRIELAEHAFADSSWKQESVLVDMYHSHNDEETCQLVQITFCRQDSSIRVLVSTVALGLGVQIPDVRLVIHWGLTDSILQYWQDIGRAGRNGQPALALAYTKPAVPHSKDSLLRLAFSTGACICKTLLNAFIGQPQPTTVCACKCCKHCLPQCNCK